MNKRAVVIGAGLAGLASAALLAKRGWQVTVLEKNTDIGGRARVFKTKGYTFDMGPSWYMMPEVFDKFFAIFGHKTADFYKLVQLDPRYQVFFEDGQQITLKSDINDNCQLFNRLETGAGNNLNKYLASAKDLYQTATQELIYQDLADWKTYLQPKYLIPALKLLLRTNPLGSWNNLLDRYFSSPKIKQILGFPAVFLGGSPDNTPGVFSLLSWGEFGGQVWYPMGGMFKVVEAVAKLALKSGAQIETGVDVEKISVSPEGKVTGVRSHNQTWPAEVVINSGDYAWGETRLLEGVWQTYPQKFWSKKTMAISAYLMYLGVNKKLPGLAHHNMYLASDWDRHFGQIFKRATWPDKPSFYVSARSRTDKSLVPKNKEELFVLVPVAAGLKEDKPKQKAIQDWVINWLEKTTGEKLQGNIEVNRMYTVADFSRDYHAYDGTALGLAHTLFQSVIFRPANISRKVRGLYYAGQYTNPGIGVPLALISAQVAASIIDKDYAKGQS